MEPELTLESGLVPLLDELTGQMAPVSLMDQGPVVAAGVPALGIAGRYPPAFADEHYRLWHDPGEVCPGRAHPNDAISGTPCGDQGVKDEIQHDLRFINLDVVVPQ